MPRHKSRALQSEDGWTHITSQSSTTPPKEPTPTPRAPVRTIAKLHVQLHSTLPRWRASSTRLRLRKLLLERGYVCENVKKIVCVGLGTPSADVSAWGVGSVMWQVACLVDLVEWFGLRVRGGRGEDEEVSEVSAGVVTCSGADDGPVRVFAQDPVFNEMDEQFLGEIGIKVLRGDEAWNMLDGSTLLYAPHFPLGNAPFSFFVGNEAEDGGPAIIVCNCLEDVKGEEPEAVRRDYKARQFVYRSLGSRRSKREDEGLERAFEGTWVYMRNPPCAVNERVNEAISD